MTDAVYVCDLGQGEGIVGRAIFVLACSRLVADVGGMLVGRIGLGTSRLLYLATNISHWL